VPDLDQRVTTLEQEVAALKDRLGANEDDMKSIPDLIKLEFRLASSQNARLSRDVAEMKTQLGEVVAKVEALPRVLAEMLADVAKRP
jgi:hypothetical protein